MKRFSVITLLVTFGWLTSTVVADDEDKKNDEAPKIAQIRLSGSFDEAPVGDNPLLAATMENFKAKLDRIRKAKDDPEVKALVLDFEDLSFSLFGYGKVNELRRTIADFRTSGKKAYAYIHAPSDQGYLVASACDVIVMPESGEVMLTGIRLEMAFFKELLDNIGVEADFLRMGDYKSAAEPFTRNSMSPENRKQYEAIVDDLYENSLIKTLIESRPGQKWTPKQVKQIIDNGPYTATKAKELGLIDHLMYPSEFEEKVKKELGMDGVEIVRKYAKEGLEIDLSNPLAIFQILGKGKKAKSRRDKIAVIYGVGPIETGKGGQSLFGGSVIGSDTMVKAIRQAEEDETVKAIVLRVDSGGGSALASDLIWQALWTCKKPVVASMGNVAGSGGYYISMGAKKIYAEPGTLTGSIGVIGGKLVTKGLFDWAGIHTDVISRGQNAGIFTTERKFNKSEEQAIRAIMEEIYEQFLNKAVKSRQRAGVDIDYDRLKSLAGGRVYTGRQAKENGLIDELGTLQDAIADARKMAKVPEDERLDLLILPEPKSFLDSLMEGGSLSMKKQSGLSQLLPLVQEFPELRQPIDAAMSLLRLRGERAWLMMPEIVRVR